MSNPKRLRTGRLQLSCLPSDLMQMVVAFAAPTLADVTALALLNRYFRAFISSPNMASHVRANFTAHWDRLDQLGPLVQGVRAAHAQSVTNLRMLSCMPRLRVLELPQGDFHSDTFNEAMKALPYLLTLNVKSCLGLVSIEALPATLLVLNVSECTNLSRLPPCLPQVYDFNANQCIDLRAMPRLPKIEVLKMVNCPAPMLPFLTVRHLKKNLRQTDPDIIAQCTALEILDVRDCDVADVDFITPLERLVSVCFEFAERDNFMDLTALASGLKNVRVLRLENEVMDEHLESVKSLRDLFSLTVMSHLVTDDGLRAIAGLHKLTYLTVDNYDCMGITGASFAACTNMQRLRNLSLKYCMGIEDVSTLASLSGLRELSFVGCMSISNLGSLGALQFLDTLEFNSCDSVTTLEGIKQIPNLETLSVMCCRNLSRGGMWALLPCPKLKHMKMCEHTCELLVEGDLEPFHIHNIELKFV